jgi:hypothetical protein
MMMRRRLREVLRGREASLLISGVIARCKYAIGFAASAIGIRCLAEIVGTLAQSDQGNQRHLSPVTDRFMAPAQHYREKRS